MKALLIQYLPWAMSVGSVVALYMAGSKHRRAWAVLMAVQVLWLLWVPLSGNWGLMLGVVAYTAVAIRNHIVWNRKETPSTIRKPICPIDPTCTFYPKGQCSRPFTEQNACWHCSREVIYDLKQGIEELR